MKLDTNLLVWFMLPLAIFLICSYLIYKELKQRAEYKAYLKRKAQKAAIAEDIDNYKWQGDQHAENLETSELATRMREAIDQQKGRSV